MTKLREATEQNLPEELHSHAGGNNDGIFLFASSLKLNDYKCLALIMIRR